MDILGSIMKNMVKPPVIDEKERKRRQLQKESQKKEQEENERRIREFRTKVDNQIASFMGNDTQLKLEFKPMDKPYRAILHDIAETAGLFAHSFGTEEVDRHVIFFKPEGIPSEGELSALRRGEVYNPESETQPEENYYNREKEETKEERSVIKARRKKDGAVPPEYLQKYEKHLGGLQVAKDAAHSTQTSNRTYGFVNSEQKRDRRTIEQTLADIKARKKAKMEDEESKKS